MLFNTPEFIIFFIFIMVVISCIKFRKFQHLFLLGSSYFFFYFSSNYLIVLLIYSTVLDFYLGREIWKTENVSRKKILLIISLAGNLGLLGFFKYADFAILQFNILGNHLNLGSNIPFLNLALPIGISFYTFQTISYTVDIYRGKLKPSESLREFALFVTFFPQLVAGPIIRASEFLPQLREKIKESSGNRLKLILIQNANLKMGVTLMAFGFLKKMFFADNIAPMVNDIFSVPYGLESFSVMLGALAFGIQIYADFSGYSDIAIGAALILGFKIPMNFNKPYFAISPSDFWKRWHISLSTWLRDYFYIPLGGNKKSSMQTYGNLFTVMVLGGLWHGAAVNFIIWGALHGSYLAIHKIINNKFPSLKGSVFFKNKFGKFISILVMQYFIFLAWLAFRIENLDALTYVLYKYVIWDFATIETIQIISHNKIPVMLITSFIILNYLSYKKDIRKTISNFKLRYWIGFLITVMTCILFFYDLNPQDFIYFRF